MSKIKLPIFYSLIFILLFSMIASSQIFPSLSNKDNAIVNFKEIIEADFIKENTDLLLISTKDGYLHALNKGKKQIWKAYLEQELMSSQFNVRELGKNFSLYPIKEQLYIFKDGELISFNIFIKDLVKRHFIKIEDFTLLGKTKTTLFIIDVDTGEILQKIDDDSNFSFKKRYILSKNKNIINVVRVDYILYCLGLEKGQKLWNVSYSDIMIQKGNEYLPDNTKIISPNIKEIINEYNINNNDYKDDISLDNVINAYSYFNQNFPPIKIYDRSESNIESELKYIKDYNEKKLDNDNIKTQKYDDLNKNKRLLELPDKDKDNDIKDIFQNDNYNNKNNKKYLIINKLKNNWYLYLIIFVLSCMVTYYKFLYKIIKNEKEIKEEKPCKEGNEKEKEINKDNNKIKNEGEKLEEKNEKKISKDKNKIINEEKEFKEIIENILDINLISIKKKSFVEKSLLKKKNSNNNLKNDLTNHDGLLRNNTNTSSDKNKNTIDINNFSSKTIEFKTQNNDKLKNSKKNLNDNSQSLDNKKENKNTSIENNGIWDEDDEEEDSNEEKEEEIAQKMTKKKEKSEIIEENEKKNNTTNKKEKTIDTNSKTADKIEKSEIKSTNGIWDDNDDDEDEVENNNNDNEPKEKTIDLNSQKINNKEKSEIKSKNGIWDDDDEEEENEEDEKEVEDNAENKKKIKKNNNSRKISKNSDNSYERKETNENTNPKNSEDINCENKKEKKLSRLDTDFENLVKIGEGGFGIVLKGTHKIDKDIYAIKIIDLTFKKKEHDEIISEAQKMKSIKGEYIVNYSICWYDDNLGSAEKFFENQDNSSFSELKNSSRLSKSISFNVIKNEKKTLFFKKESKEDIYDIKEVNDEDNYDENNISDSKNISRSKSKNKNNSLELYKNNNTNQIYNNRSKYCFDYMDDSKLLNNSILSRKYNEEIYSNKDKKYFFILMEYCDGLTLENYIKEHSNKSIERKTIYTYIKQILKGLKKLHKNGIIHRDIKPGNIFIKNEQIKIGDFGLATKFQKNSILQTKDLRGFTPTYAAPEQTKSKTYNEKIDIYATGITLYEMCSCFGTEMERQLALRDLKNKGIISDRITNDYPQETKLIIMMTKEDYNDRPSAEQILKSDLFEELGKIVNK